MEQTTLGTRRHLNNKKSNGAASHAKPGSGPKPVERSHKLGTFSGVFVPTFLNLLSILMFLRFGFILGQAGVLGMMGLLILAFVIDLITTFSLSAIASNGTVRGGGAYYLISRSLGPEFGGSIGVVFYMGLVFNTGLNAVGLIDCITQNFGSKSGSWHKFLPESMWWNYLWATVVLLVCTAICLAGSAIFARASKGLLVLLIVSTISIPISALIVPPFESRKLGIVYTGLSAQTFRGNLMPNLTRGAAGSRSKGKETFQDLFGVLFPATSGIFAGASMSGDLKHPSKAIPKGTLYGLALTFVLYTLVIFAMAGTITRSSLLQDVNIIQDTNFSVAVVLLGEFASTFFSTLMGVIGSAKLCQALARDKLLPGLSMFGYGTKKADEPVYAIFLTYIVAQITMLADINEIASFVTMTYLMTFLVMNLATFLLKIGSAPNFRPSFHFFTWQSAFVGTIASGAAMFFVDGVFASGCVAILILIFLLIHYTTPPKSWGDVSQNLIYHQVRKYLLRLRQEHVKFWRPQILLLVNDPRRQYKLIQFCNHMKKGALYILGHVIVSSDFGGSVPEARRQQAAWAKYIDFSKVKAFVNIAISPGLEWGARNIIMTAGLGGMRPNIAVLGFYNMDELRRALPLIDITPEPDASVTKPQGLASDRTELPRLHSNDRVEGQLPTDYCRTESMISPSTYVTVLEDLLFRLQINVALARGFQQLEFPHKKAADNTKKYIDLWPIQMSAEIEDSSKNNILTTNFDTYTLILQLGCILNTVPSWKKAYKLRVAVFVEYESDVDEERGRVKSLLESLRIQAEIIVFWLASGELSTYEIIVNGANPGEDAEQEVEEYLKNQEWWHEIQMIRGKRGDLLSSQDLAEVANVFTNASAWPEASFQQGPRHERIERFWGLRKLLKKTKRRHTMSGITRLGVNLGMTTHRLAPQLVRDHPSHGSASEDSESSGDDDFSIFQENDDGSAASEGDIEIESSSETDTPLMSPAKLTRRRSHGDAIRGPRPSKRATGEKEPKVPEPVSRRSSNLPPLTGTSNRPASISNLTDSVGSLDDLPSGTGKRPVTPRKSLAPPSFDRQTPQRLEERFEALRSGSSPRQVSSPSPSKSVRPPLSRHASMPKFTSKPVPVARVATEEGPGPSIMFTDTPSPPIERRKRHLPSAYSQQGASSSNTASTEIPDHTSEVSESSESRDKSPQQQRSRTGSTYSTQSVPLSFNDLPCRAQHLILNQLIRQNSADTAVMFTTLPSPIEGTCKSEDASVAYLSDLEVLVNGVPPCLLVHSNSMTVTVSL